MENLENIAESNLQKAFEIIRELKIEKIYEELNSTCNLVGSVKTGLLMSHLDIDFHVYSDEFSVEKSFNAIAKIIARKYGEQSFKSDEEKYDLADEFADVLFVLICLANQTGVDLSDAFTKNLEKKSTRDKTRHQNNKKLLQ